MTDLGLGNGPCQRIDCCRESVVHRKPIGGNSILGFCEDHDPRRPAGPVRKLWSPRAYLPGNDAPAGGPTDG